MSDTVRRIRDVTRAAREPGASSDPRFFERKAALLEAIVAEDPWQAETIAQLVAEARTRASELRRSRS